MLSRPFRAVSVGNMQQSVTIPAFPIFLSWPTSLCFRLLFNGILLWHYLFKDNEMKSHFNFIGFPFNSTVLFLNPSFSFITLICELVQARSPAPHICMSNVKESESFKNVDKVFLYKKSWIITSCTMHQAHVCLLHAAY